MGSWTIGRAASTVAFSVGNFWISKVHGQMCDFEGVLEVDADGSLSIRGSANVASIETGIAKRDNHLRSAAFLDAARHPRAELRSHSVRQLDGGRLAIDAELTLRGISGPLWLVASIPPAKAVDGDEFAQIRITASGALDRRRFAIPRGRLLDKIVGAEVDLSFEVYAAKTGARTR